MRQASSTSARCQRSMSMGRPRISISTSFESWPLLLPQSRCHPMLKSRWWGLVNRATSPSTKSLPRNAWTYFITGPHIMYSPNRGPANRRDNMPRITSGSVGVAQPMGMSVGPDRTLRLISRAAVRSGPSMSGSTASSTTRYPSRWKCSFCSVDGGPVSTGGLTVLTVPAPARIVPWRTMNRGLCSNFALFEAC
jgi:hypothetical protein